MSCWPLINRQSGRLRVVDVQVAGGIFITLSSMPWRYAVFGSVTA